MTIDHSLLAAQYRLLTFDHSRCLTIAPFKKEEHSLQVAVRSRKMDWAVALLKGKENGLITSCCLNAIIFKAQKSQTGM